MITHRLTKCLSAAVLLAVAWIPFILLSPDTLFARRRLWLLAIAPAALIVIWAFEQKISRSAWETSPKKTFTGLIGATALASALFLFLWAGYLMSLVNFSYTSWGFPPVDFFRLARAFVFLFALRFFAAELFLRGFVFRAVLQKSGAARAILVMLIVQNAVFIPYWLTEHSSERNLGPFRAILIENMVGIEAAAVFSFSGSVLASSLFHALIDFSRITVMADAESRFESLYIFSTSSSAFYWLMAANHVLVCAVLVALVLRGVILSRRRGTAPTAQYRRTKRPTGARPSGILPRRPPGRDAPATS
ncbi:MAG: hypothetical protein HY587_08640 [Candidatus Omnitrophica bacterium]|nr:hypothetical protein [Candidatus Omnitrophota bacterium]